METINTTDEDFTHPYVKSTEDNTDDNVERCFKAYHYIAIGQRTENILVIEINEENEEIIENIDKTYYSSKLEIYNFSTIEGVLSHMPPTIKKFVEDMDKDGKTRMNYQIDKFDNNTLMDEYIKKMKEDINKAYEEARKEIKENNSVENVNN